MTVNLGVIGTGAIGTDHIRRCHYALSGAAVVAVNDINAEQARKAVSGLGIDAEVYASAQDLINAANVDAILVTSWGPAHEEQVLAAIAAGKPVFCEKPLAVTAAGCLRIVNAEQAHGKRLVQVGYMREYDQGYLALKAAIDSGQIGAPLMLHCAHRNPTVPTAYGTSMAITDTLIHELDVLRWLLDDDYVSAQVIFPRRTSHTHSALRDPQIVLLETVKGVRIDVEVFVNCRYGYDIQCQVVGEEGIASLPEPSSIQMRSGAKLSNEILMDWKDRFIQAYDVELQAFIRSVANGEIGGPSSWNGYAAAVAADACIQAQESGAIVPITMPVKPAFYS
ncbi:Gfo/Idh/MocA family oxidoreductase [Pseudomonas sp. dw_358]|uniref:Gfo/Idh/MocA family protein n=1 Tax=Pseudomonas sp. dw_358 TaxID=2720083 RepID=UPI001BD1F57F|nr:Gfo/Idh/MocA family oxidoreductase [Pseudomonas sp. dw_358]